MMQTLKPEHLATIYMASVSAACFAVLPAGSDRFRPSFPSAVPSDRGRLEELERRVAELERRLDSPNPARYRETWANPPGPSGGHQ